MRLTAIDIGTNTVLMLVADVSAGGVVSPVRDEQVIARLGKGVDAERRITPEATARVLAHLKDYKAISESLRSDAIFACGTSALRDAANGQEFAEEVRDKLGFEVTILSGLEEAEWTYRGAVSEFCSEDSRSPFAVLDIGGGSTELTIGEGLEVAQRASLDVGSVRLTERILINSPPQPEALELAANEVRNWVFRLPELPSATRLIGVAGTPTTLAAIDLKLQRYDRQFVSGHRLTTRTIETIFAHLKTRTVREIMEDSPLIQPGRADIIVAGILILLESMRKLGVEAITVSDRGLRYGVALRQFLKRADKRLP
jgi:exopolyphosphatase / guanosine-5'-triphosphate,3'-diphosphate pyrophosphatase